MSVSILEALLNADANLENNHPFTIQLAKRQLHNAVVLLEKDYPLNTKIEPLLEKYGDVESVPSNNKKKEIMVKKNALLSILCFSCKDSTVGCDFKCVLYNKYKKNIEIMIKERLK